MDVFVIHSYSDRKTVEKKIEELKAISKDFNPLMLEKEEHFWKINARKKIKNSQVVVCFVGKESHNSKNIEWELLIALKYQKPIYTIKLDESVVLPEVLKYTDPFSKEIRWYSTSIELSKFAMMMNAPTIDNHQLFNPGNGEIDLNLLLEQYKVFLQTSEDLVARRQNVNNFYISINSAIVTVFGGLLALDIPSQYQVFASCVLAIVGIILSVSWIKLLVSYGDLNGSKMKVISLIEKKLPASLFDAEWTVLSNNLNKRKYVSFTNSEKRVPKLFIIVYICIFIGVLALLF